MDQDGAFPGRERLNDNLRVIPRRQGRVGDREQNGAIAGEDLRQQELQFALFRVWLDEGLRRPPGGGHAPQSSPHARKDDRVIRSPARAEYDRRFADRRRWTAAINCSLLQSATAPESDPAAVL
jgi:hypothetical protein